jgi:hypothetical protein
MDRRFSREASSFSASQEIPRILWKPSPLPLPLLGQINPVQTSILFLQSVILPSTYRFSKLSLFIRTPLQLITWYASLLFPIRAAHLIHFDFVTNIMLPKEYT